MAIGLGLFAELYFALAEVRHIVENFINLFVSLACYFNQRYIIAIFIIQFRHLCQACRTINFFLLAVYA